MKSRHTLLAALAAFAFFASAIAVAAPPFNPCQQCRDAYQRGRNTGGLDGTRDCEPPFSQGLLSAGGPLE